MSECLQPLSAKDTDVTDDDVTDNDVTVNAKKMFFGQIDSVLAEKNNNEIPENILPVIRISCLVAHVDFMFVYMALC